MKKFYLVATIFVLSLTLGMTAMAQGKASQRSGKKAACASCTMNCATQEQVKKFKADSIDLRQQLMNKRFDLQREELKETPDTAKIAAVKAEIESLKAKLNTMKTAAKLPSTACRCLDSCALMDCDNCSCAKNCTTAAPAKAKKSAKDAAGCKQCILKGAGKL